MLSIIEKINSALGSTVTIFLLLSGIAVTASLFIYFAMHPNRFISSLLPKRAKKGERTPLGSLCLALAGTLGVGNISGVAAAIAVGGAGAVFWMWICSLFCASLKYAETVLAIKYRIRSENGQYAGGAHLYIKNGLKLPVLGSIFCILCVFSSFTTGNMIQVNAAAQSLKYAIGIPEYICGAAMLILILIFCRNGSAIYSFTLRLIPFLCLGYVILCASVIFPNLSLLDDITKAILSSAFSPKAGAGGIIGVICGRTLRTGITRGVMSNEAGCGTAPIAHASANTKHPAAQGFLGMIEVLFDTLFLCTLTAYVILIADLPTKGEPSTVSVINSFTSVLGDCVAVPIAISMLLFALASAAGWNYYGRVSLSHLGANNISFKLYSIVYAVFAFIGATVKEGAIWQLSDLSIYLMSFINTSAVLLLFPTVKKETSEYIRRKKM